MTPLSKTTFFQRINTFPKEGEAGFAYLFTNPTNYRFKYPASPHTKNLLKNIISAPE